MSSLKHNIFHVPGTNNKRKTKLFAKNGDYKSFIAKTKQKKKLFFSFFMTLMMDKSIGIFDFLYHRSIDRSIDGNQKKKTTKKLEWKMIVVSVYFSLKLRFLSSHSIFHPSINQFHIFWSFQTNIFLKLNCRWIINNNNSKKGQNNFQWWKMQ